MNIVIAGGGTAGWLAALFFVKAHPNKHTVTLIESSQLGIIGAGEGSTGSMYDLLSNAWFDTGCTIPEFMAAVDATPKLGIRHKNWTPTGDSYYAPLDGSPTSGISPDLDFLKMFAKEGKDGMYKASNIGKHFDQHKLPKGGAFHFDAHKIGQYFKKVLGEKVTVIDSVINRVGTNLYGHIDRVYLDDGRAIGGDFFIDCTGFKRTLMNELKIGWKPYNMNLPVDRAMPFILPYKENVEVEPVTVAHALSAGWMWQIPTAARLGCGYVFQSSCLTADQAQEEVEKTLGCKIDPIRIIEFNSGRGQALWQGNCLALGLSAAFAEPLEATSIHTTIIQLLNFTFEYLTEDFDSTVTDTNIKLYNEKMTKMYDDILDFLVIHYQGGRTDSEFWQWISNGHTLTSFAAEVLDRSSRKIPGVLNFDYYFGCVGAPLWNWVLAGIGRITPEQAVKELELYQKI